MPIDFAELQATDDVYQEIGRRYVEAILLQEALEAAIAGTLDFAAKGSKKPNCTSKSHFCQTPNGRGSCVPLKKQCKFSPGGAAKQAADYVGQKAGGGVTQSDPSKIGDYTVEKVGVRALRQDLEAHDTFYSGLLGGNDSITDQQFDRLDDNNLVREWLLDEASQQPRSRPEFVAIRDADGNAQAVASISQIDAENGVRVGNLVTAPWNIVAGDDPDPRQVRGAGTSAIAAMAQRSIAAGHGGKVTLDAIDNAIPFYERLGFRSTGTNGTATTMELSPAAAQQLLSNFQNQ
jgi:hypothetical protein